MTDDIEEQLAEMSAMFVQTAHEMTFDGERLTLHGLTPATLFFSDRPERVVGHLTPRQFVELVGAPEQLQFGRDKLELLPRYCMECDVRFACHGGCPKDRFVAAPDGQAGLNYLCSGFRTFFSHVDEPMRAMCALLRAGRAPAEIVAR